MNRGSHGSGSWNGGYEVGIAAIFKNFVYRMAKVKADHRTTIGTVVHLRKGTGTMETTIGRSLPMDPVIPAGLRLLKTTLKTGTIRIRTMGGTHSLKVQTGTVCQRHLHHSRPEGAIGRDHLLQVRMETGMETARIRGIGSRMVDGVSFFL